MDLLELQNQKSIDLSKSLTFNLKTSVLGGCLKENSFDLNVFNVFLRLNELNLSNNQINEVKNSFTNLNEDDYFLNSREHIKILNLSNNQIVDIKSICIKGLTSLNLSHNEIKEIQVGAFFSYQSLKNIDLSSNHIKILKKETFCGLSALKNLNLDNNEIERIDENAFDGLINLESLSLNGNLICDYNLKLFNSLSKLKKLFLSPKRRDENKIIKISDKTFFHLPALELLSLKDFAHIEKINNCTFDGLKNLKELNLSGNTIKEFEEQPFKDLKYLEELDLSKTKRVSNVLNMAKHANMANLIRPINSNLKEVNEDVIKIISFNDEKITRYLEYDPILFKTTAKYLSLFADKKFELVYFHNTDDKLDEKNALYFYGKDRSNDNFGTKYTIHPVCFESIELVEKDFKRLKKGFMWQNKKRTRLNAIIGLNGAGKTSFLDLIDKSIDKNHPNFVSKYFNSANQKLITNQEEHRRLNSIICTQTENIENEEQFKVFVYESINDFSLLQYFDYLLLIGFDHDDFNKIDKNLFEYEFSKEYIDFRKAEQKYFLHGFKDKTKEPSFTYYSMNRLNEFQSIEHYLKVNKDHRLSPGEYLILLIQLWSMHAKKLNTNMRKKLRILLLDEPDTFMHPKLIKHFIELIQSEHLELLNLNIIMTTHNPVTVNFLEKDNIFELKYNKESGLRSIASIEEKSSIIYSLSDNLFYIKEKFKIIYIEGQKEEDKAFYEFVFSMKCPEKNLPVKFIEMGSKTFSQLFLKTNLDPSQSLNEFLFGINDGDYLIQNARDLFNIDKEYDSIGNYHSNFKRLNRYCMENYIYDPINLSFALKHLIGNKELVASDNANTLYNEFIDFTKIIKQYKSIQEFVAKDADSVTKLNSILEKFNKFYMDKLNAKYPKQENHEFLKKYCLKDFTHPNLEKKIPVDFQNGIQLNYYPILLYLSGKNELLPLLNEEIIKKIYNLTNNNSRNSIREISVHSAQNLNENQFDPIDYFFALNYKLNEYKNQLENMDENENQLNKSTAEQIKKSIKKIRQILGEILPEYAENKLNFNDNNYLTQENEQILNKIIKGSCVYIHKLLKEGEFHQIINHLKKCDNLNENEKILFKYCLAYKFMKLFSDNHKIRNETKLKKENTKEIYEKVINSGNKYMKQIKENLEKSNELVKHYPNELNHLEAEDRVKNLSKTINEDFKKMEETLTACTEEKFKGELKLKFNPLFKNIKIDLLKNVYSADLNLILTIPKEKIIKTFEESGILLDNDLAEIMENIIESI